MTETQINHLIDEATLLVHGKGRLAKNHELAEEKLRQAMDIDRSGRSHYIFGVFLKQHTTRHDEYGQVMAASARAGFIPGFIAEVIHSCQGKWYGDLSDEVLAKLKRAADAGYVQARILWLCNHGDYSWSRLLGRTLQIRKAKRLLEEARCEGKAKKDELYWG